MQSLKQSDDLAVRDKVSWSEDERIRKWVHRISEKKEPHKVINHEGLRTWLQVFSDEQANERFEKMLKLNGVLTLVPRNYVPIVKTVCNS